MQYAGQFEILRCAISDNEASSNGAVFYMDGTRGSITHSSVTGNTASGTGSDAGGTATWPSAPTPACTSAAAAATCAPLTAPAACSRTTPFQLATLRTALYSR